MVTGLGLWNVWNDAIVCYRAWQFFQATCDKSHDNPDKDKFSVYRNCFYPIQEIVLYPRSIPVGLSFGSSAVSEFSINIAYFQYLDHD